MREDHGLARLCHLRPLMRLGALSNGVYLLHLPAIGVANSIFARLNFTPPFGDLLLGLVMVMAAAELSFRYYEAPS